MSNIFQIKRGSGAPTTTALSLDGELGYDKTNSTLYINNNGTIEVPFARVKAENIDGTLTATQIPNLNASKITSGTLPVARGGTGQTAITASRLLYSNSTTQLASTSITSDGSYLGNISYLTINAAHQTGWRFYVNGNAILGPNSMWYVQDNRYNASTNPSSDTYGAGFYMNDSNGTTRAYVREMALTNGWQGIQTEAKRVVNNTNIYSTLNLLIDANGNRQAILNSRLYAYEGLTVAEDSAFTGNLSVTGTIAGNELYSGSSTTTADRHIFCNSQAGNIFLYSNGSSATGERGIWLHAHGTGAAKAVFSVDTNNNITFATTASDININKSSGDTYYYAKRTDTNVQVGFGVGSGGTNHGIWSSKQERWLIYGDNSEIYIGGRSWPKFTYGTGDPSASSGAVGDIYIKYS